MRFSHGSSSWLTCSCSSSAAGYFALAWTLAEAKSPQIRYRSAARQALEPTIAALAIAAGRQRRRAEAGDVVMSRRRTLFALLAGAVAIAGAVKCAVFPGHPFDAILWSDPERIKDGVRLGMADRLLARATLIGLTRPQLAAMLGEPPPTSYFSDWDVAYRLGMERGFISIDSEWLVIRFGPDGRVAQARIVTD